MAGTAFCLGEREIAALPAMSFHDKFYVIYASLEKDGDGLEA